MIASDCPKIGASTTIDPQDQPVGVEAAESFREYDEKFNCFKKKSFGRKMTKVWIHLVTGTP